MGERLLGGRYRLDEIVGSGGTGQVWRAHDTLLDRVVAVKQLRPGQDVLMRERLRVEARLAGGLHHPGIAQVFDYGEEPVGDEVAPYLVMQYVEGATLREVLRERRLLPASEVMDLVAQVAAALHAAHRQGIVHRDLKPGNVIVTPGGRAVLVDFGIARSPELEPMTMTGTIIGTADYISPEQGSGGSATTRSDLYALGLIAYECLSGLKPFRRESELATVLAHLNDDVPPLDGSLPAGVRDLVDQMVAKRPEDRPADAGEVARRAAALAAGDAATSITAMVPRRRTRRHRRRRPLALPLAGLVAAVAVAALAFAVGRPPSTAVPEQPRESDTAQPASRSGPSQQPKGARPSPSERSTTAPAAAKPKPAAEPPAREAGGEAGDQVREQAREPAQEKAKGGEKPKKGGKALGKGRGKGKKG